MRPMRQLTFLGPGSLEWRDVPEPALTGEGEALVRPIAVATCDLDIALLQGAAALPGPFAFGHEFVADVVEVSDGAPAAVGDRVLVPFQISCGQCPPCLRGSTGSCEVATPLASYGLAPFTKEWGGALSDLVRVPYADAMLVPLPRDVDAAAVASVSDNVPDGYRGVAPGLAARPGVPVLILGGAAAGSVGLYAAAVAVALGSERVDYVDRDPVRLAVAERVGANPIDTGFDRDFGRYPVTVDHTGEHDGLRAAIKSTENDGICTATAIYFERSTPLPMLEMYTNGITFRTGRVNARHEMPAVLDLVVAGKLAPELVTAAVLDWDDAAEGLLEQRFKTVVTRP